MEAVAAGRAAIAGDGLSELGRAALWYASLGHPVAPLQTPMAGGYCSCGNAACSSAGKHPRFDAGDFTSGLSDATIDSDQIRTWWTRWPNANIAIRCDRFDVLDEDFKSGGDIALGGLTMAHGPLPFGPTSETGNGVHYLFVKAVPPVASRAEGIATGLDVKGTGGYIVAPPSRHANGKTYTWAPDMDITATLPEWPAWLLLLARRSGPVRTNGHAATRTRELRNDRYSEGSRNDKLARDAGSFRRIGLNETEIESRLLAINAAACVPPLPEAEVLKIAHSVARYDPAALPVHLAPQPQLLRDETPADAEEAFQSAPLTELGNSERLIALYGARLRWTLATSWLVWDERRWTRNDGQVERWAADVVRRLWALVEVSDLIKTEADVKAILRHAKSSERHGAISALVNLATTNERIRMNIADFDTDPMLLNVANGTIDLRTGGLVAHDPVHYITRVAAVTYDPTATAPRWLAFLDQIFDGDLALIAYVQRLCGYICTGDTSEQIVAIFYGTGANGKSSLLKVLGSILAGYARTAQPSTFHEKQGDGIPNDIARLAGARLVVAVEGSSTGRNLNEELIKQMSGGDPLTARFLHQEFFEFLPQFKLIFAVNSVPRIRGTNEGIWRRIQLVPFGVEIAPADRDKHLADTLVAQESPGILNWLVEGCSRWQIEGLHPPASVSDATRNYRTSMDQIERFIDERCELSSEVAATALYAAYSAWTETAGEHARSNIWFGKELATKGFTARKRSADGGKHYYQGIRLAPLGASA